MQTVEARIEEARRSMGDELERFAENTLEYLRKERHLLVDDPDVPDLSVNMKSRHVLVVVRGPDYKDDLQTLRRSGYLSELKPLLVGVDGGADALLEMGWTPDLIIGDMDSVSERGAALRRGAGRPRLRGRPGTGCRALGPTRCGAPGLVHARHQRGHRHAARLREGRRAHRRSRHPLAPWWSSSTRGVPAWLRRSWSA